MIVAIAEFYGGIFGIILLASLSLVLVFPWIEIRAPFTDEDETIDGEEQSHEPGEHEMACDGQAVDSLQT